MIGRILAFFVKLGGSAFLDRIFDHLEARANSETERQRIAATRETTMAQTQANVVIAGMSHKMFWVAWSIAAIPTSAWYGWGMLDSLIMDGALLPDVAALPPQLKAYADTVWANIFYTGGAVAGVTGAAGIVAKAIERRK